TSTSFSLLLTLALVLPGAAALGAETEPAGGTPVPLVIAVADAPSLAAARARAQAAGERLGAAGRVPDPQIGGLFSRPSAPGDDMTMWEVAVRQPLPKAGERAADRDRAAAALERARADFALMSGETAADVAL